MNGRHRAVAKPASPISGDAGFTMLEVIIAILLIGGAMLSVLAATTSGVVFQGMARQRQTAVGLANQTMEELRSLPIAQIQAGTISSAITVYNGLGNCFNGANAQDGNKNCPLTNTSDPHIMSCGTGASAVFRLFSCDRTDDLGSGEQIVSHECAANCPGFPPLVYPDRGNAGTRVIDGVTYFWRAYITQPSSAQPYRLTVTVDWQWRGRIVTTRLQSLASIANGCISNQTHFVGAPCLGGVSGGGGGGVMNVGVRWTGASQTPWTFSFGSLTAKYTTEQTTDLLGSSTLMGGTQISLVRSTADPAVSSSSYDSRFSTGSSSTDPGKDWYAVGTTPAYSIAASSDATYPKVVAYFDTAGGNGTTGPGLFATGAVSGAATSCNLADQGVPCLSVQNNATNSSAYAVTIAYMPNATKAYPLVRVARGTASPNTNTLWSQKFQFSPGATAGSTLVKGSRILPNISIGGRGTNLSACGLVCTTYLGTMTMACDSLQVTLAPQANGSLAESTPYATPTLPTGCASGSTQYGYRHSSSFAYYQPSGTTCTYSTDWTTPLSVSAGTAYACDNSGATATTKYLWKMTNITWSTPTRYQDGQLSFRYQVFTCTPPGSGNLDNHCKVSTNYTTASTDTPQQIYVDITLPRLQVSPSDYEYW